MYKHFIEIVSFSNIQPFQIMRDKREPLLRHQIQFLSSQQMKEVKEQPWHRLQLEHISPSAQEPYLCNIICHRDIVKLRVISPIL